MLAVKYFSFFNYISVMIDLDIGFQNSQNLICDFLGIYRDSVTLGEADTLDNKAHRSKRTTSVIYSICIQNISIYAPLYIYIYIFVVYCVHVFRCICKIGTSPSFRLDMCIQMSMYCRLRACIYACYNKITHVHVLYIFCSCAYMY